MKTNHQPRRLAARNAQDAPGSTITYMPGSYGPWLVIAMLFVTLLVLAAFHGCANGQIPKWSDFTDKDKATFLNGVYNQEFENYKVAVARPSMTPEQKSTLAVKKQVFSEVWPLLKLYTTYAENGQLVPADLEPQILALLARVKGAI